MMPLPCFSRPSRLLPAPRRSTWCALGAGLLLNLTGATAAERADRSADCSSSGGSGTTRQLECRLDRSQGAPSYRFEARFSGAHDDTVASLEAALDGAPDACGPGSKTYLVGEDGDVSLHCTIAGGEPAGASQVLRVQVRWSHAEFVGFELLRD